MKKHKLILMLDFFFLLLSLVCTEETKVRNYTKQFPHLQNERNLNRILLRLENIEKNRRFWCNLFNIFQLYSKKWSFEVVIIQSPYNRL